MWLSLYEVAPGAAARTDEVVAGAAVASANREDRGDTNEPGWDTAERRQQLAESLEGNGDREAVNSRLIADKHQGTRPAAAVAEKTLAGQDIKDGQTERQRQDAGTPRTRTLDPVGTQRRLVAAAGQPTSR